MVTKCNWRLVAVSKAAKNLRKVSFVLKAGANLVGKKKDSHIKIPSILCSREHCSIFLDGDRVTLTDTSRNGTYITFSHGTQHFTNTSTEPLEQNDMISFGFNTASVYDINDKHAFMYRLVKEKIETINIDDSDDDDDDGTPPPPVVKDKFIAIDNRVIDIDSDSDSNYSGDECLKNIEEFKDEESVGSSVQFEDDSSIDNYSDSIESSVGSGDENFVVTKTILKCTTPTETISLDEDDEDDVPDVQAQNQDDAQISEISDKASNGTIEKPSTAMETDEPTKSTETQAPELKLTEIDTTSKEDDQQSEDSENSMPGCSSKTRSEENNARKPSTESDNHVETSPSKEEEKELESRLEGLKRKLAEKPQKKISLIKAQPLRKRRSTITEEEYLKRKKIKQQIDPEQSRQMKRERLAIIGEQQKARRIAAAESVGESNRPKNMPKVKINAVSRGEQLCTDMLALGNTST
ncbi:probable serine/threonine-protein kinase kinX [Contarinia nasturtii]|uniref:probable serine/threonine-protein kinase kinX n=1 Tax=Contarinia nasturtii TaxID=265458 RepID=UPI0012D496D7|nr:probable serine/threonine-protein kinase kinX [Contarinia nasturtii]